MSLRCPCSDLQGAFWGLTLGLLLGLIRLVLDFIYPQPRCDQQDTRPSVVKDVHYLYFSMVLSAVTLVSVSVVSWATEPPSREMVHRGLYWIQVTEKGPHRFKSRGWNVGKAGKPGLGFGDGLISGPSVCPLILTKQKHEYWCPSQVPDAP